DTTLFPNPPAYPSEPDAYLDADERIVTSGDILSVGGEIIEEIDTRERSPDFRDPPTRMLLLARSLHSARAGSCPGGSTSRATRSSLIQPRARAAARSMPMGRTSGSAC